MVFDKTRDCQDCYSHLVCGVYNPNFDNFAPECNFYTGKDDYIKVVRCKDCKHYKKVARSGIEDIRMCEWDTKFRRPYDFCSCGIRKE